MDRLYIKEVGFPKKYWTISESYDYLVNTSSKPIENVRRRKGFYVWKVNDEKLKNLQERRLKIFGKPINVILGNK
jgi:hypothetical protein